MLPPLKDIPKYVVTIPRLIERHAHTIQEFAKVGWDFEFVMGQDRLDYDEAYLRHIRTKVWPGTKKRDNHYAGRLACMASHRLAAERIVSENHPWAMICEDDIEIYAGINEVDLTMVPADVDLLFLGGRTAGERWVYRGPLYCSDWFVCLHCYVFPQRIARELVEIQRPEVDRAADWTTRVITRRLKSYLYTPTLVANMVGIKSHINHTTRSQLHISRQWFIGTPAEWRERIFPTVTRND